MNPTRIRAKILNSRRRSPLRGLRSAVLSILSFNPNGGGFTKTGEVKNWNITEPRITKGDTTALLYLTEDSVATPEVLAICQFAVNRLIYKATTRVEPVGASRQWQFSLESTGNYLP